MLRSPLSKKKDSKKGKGSKRSKSPKSCTILRAVPVATKYASAPLSPLEQDMETLPNEEILANIGGRSPPRLPAGQNPIRSFTQVSHKHSRSRSMSASALSPIFARTELRFPEPQNTIGIYQDGRIQWDQKSSMGNSDSSSSSTKSQRPRIQVIIPNDQRYRPLPTSPFFGQAPFGFGNIRSSSHDVSPPGEPKKNHVRDSVVSPMSTQQHQHPVSHFHPPLVPQKLESSNKANNPASSSSDESHEDDESSIYSKRSSISSVDAVSPPKISKMRINFQESSASATFSIKSPVLAGVFNPDPHGPAKSEIVGETGSRPYPIISPRRRYAPHPSIQEAAEFVPTCGIRPLRPSNTIQRQPTITRRTSTSKRASRRSSSAPDITMDVINQAISRSSSAQLARGLPSPTLSEAENDLEQHLTSFTDDDPFKWDEIILQTLGSMNDAPPPTLPRKSSKRDSNMNGPEFRLSKVPGNHIVSQLNRSQGKGKALKINIPELPEILERSKRMTDDFILSPIPIPPRTIKRAITPAVAEDVILGILRNLGTFDDLFATAVLNRGFYRVFKRHELDLMKATMRKMSPPAWEHREICYPGHDIIDDEDLDFANSMMEYTPTTYFQYHMRGLYILEELKAMIKHKCQSFVRPEIAIALASDDQSQITRVNDALWRIWTFCKIFGSGKGREDDVVAQMDWLRGGVLVHQKTCTFSILTTESIDMNDTLASAPECFAKGNEGGLTAEQLFDMMELWNCLGVLLQPFEGRTIQAREYGIYDNTSIRGGDIDGEELMLDEWCYYILTLGLSPILELAGPCRSSEPSAFLIASERGWMNWNPPVFGGTRRNFLKEAASRVYEDKIAVTYAESSTREVNRQLSKQRIQRHITELRKRKVHGELLGPVRMSQERPISDFDEVLDNLTRHPPPPPSTSNLISHVPSLRSNTPNPPMSRDLAVSTHELPASRTPPPPNNGRPRSPPTRTVAQPLLPTPPPSTVPSVSGDHRSSIAPSMPSIEEHPAFRNRKESVPEMPALDSHPAFGHLRSRSIPSTSGSSRSEEHPAYQQHHLQHTILQGNAAENSAEKAVYRIVEMGFTPEQARHALRMTDLGDGLRVEAAVELLLRECSFN